MKRIIIALVSFMTLNFGFSQWSCNSPIQFEDNDIISINPPTDSVSLYMTFTSPIDVIDFDFIASSIFDANGVNLCPIIEIKYFILNQLCNPIDSSNDGFFDGLEPNGDYILNFTATCPQSGIRFIFTGERIVLPIELINFHCESTPSGVMILFGTLSELDISHFIIERSSDGMVWKDICHIEPKGGFQLNNYTYLDRSPVDGFNYYRLIQVDRDGSRSIIKVDFIQWDSKNWSGLLDKFTILGQVKR